MHPELQDHPAYFERQVVQLADNVYQAFGFAASNVYMIIGEDGLIIVDTTETTAAAENVMAEFRKISGLPIRTIILTHSHRDHVSGASVFAAEDNPEILASMRSSGDSLTGDTQHPRPVEAMKVRTRRQFGIGLSYPDENISLGMGPGNRPLKGMGAGIMEPTRRIDAEHEKTTICGIDLELIMAPGETPDHMVVWYPAKQVLISGDNYYRSFPNLYAIRGTEYREFDVWADTLDQLMALEPEVLGPGHTKALTGADHIRQVLCDYRDAIRHIVRQTREGLDAGKTFDELAHSVRLPSDLAQKPYLREFYGRVDFAVRAYCVGTMGWFDGNPTSLSPLEPVEEANLMIALAGGPMSVWDAVTEARAEGNYQWALQLIDRLIRVGDANAPAAKAEVLRQHAKAQINCPTRNYFIQSAKELEEKAD